MAPARALRIVSNTLSLTDLIVGEPGPSEVRVAVRAAGLNRADLMQLAGRYPAPPGSPPDIPGLEFAGIVERCGSAVRDWKAGDRVMGIVGGGAMSTHLVVHERELLEIPAGLAMSQAAAIPEVFLTAYDALFEIAGLSAGQRVLIHAVGSGVGTAALQLAKLTGAIAIGTTRSSSKLERARTLGLEHGLLAGDPPRFGAEVHERWGGADVILDTVGASYLAENVRALAPRGRMVCLATLGGATGELPLGALLGKRARIEGSVLRARRLEEKAGLARRFAKLIPAFEAGALRPVVERVFSFEQAAEAFATLERNEAFGKLVFEWAAQA
jgi:NADPH:quinone reductase